MIRCENGVAAATMATNNASARNPAFFGDQHRTFDRLDTDFAGRAVAERIFVQVSCGSIMRVEVPVGMSPEQVLVQFRKGQLVMALTGLLIGTPLLFALTFMG